MLADPSHTPKPRTPGKLSAGLLMYRRRFGRCEVLLVHPGGPFWTKKDDGAWSIPKGEVSPGEDLLSAAQREFEEEIGYRPDGRFVPLGTVKQKAGKTVQAWAFEGSCDPATIRSNKFAIEWPPRSGRMVEFPEIDRAEFFELAAARAKVNAAQVEFVSRLEQLIADGGA
jgi:predicted NUDIX family NTP pyrophosphohydrolase